MFKFKINDLHCKSCINSIKDAVQTKDQSADVDGDVKKSEVYIKAKMSEAQVKSIIEKLDFRIN